jgi:hypothetical protein
MRPCGVAPTLAVCATAGDDPSVRASHGDRDRQHLRSGEPTWVHGGHFGPRRGAPEMQLLAWLGGATD